MPWRRRPASGSPRARASWEAGRPASARTRAAPCPRRAGRRGRGREGAARPRPPSTALLGLGEQPRALHPRVLEPHRAPAPGVLLPPAVLLVLEDQRRSEEHTSELQSQFHLVCRLLLEKKKKK